MLPVLQVLQPLLGANKNRPVTMGQYPMTLPLLPLFSVESRFRTDRRRLSIGGKSVIF